MKKLLILSLCGVAASAFTLQVENRTPDDVDAVTSNGRFRLKAGETFTIQNVVNTLDIRDAMDSTLAWANLEDMTNEGIQAATSIFCKTDDGTAYQCLWQEDVSEMLWPYYVAGWTAGLILMMWAMKIRAIKGIILGGDARE